MSRSVTFQCTPWRHSASPRWVPCVVLVELLRQLLCYESRCLHIKRTIASRLEVICIITGVQSNLFTTATLGTELKESGKLVPRVSRGREDGRPWERGLGK